MLKWITYLGLLLYAVQSFAGWPTFNVLTPEKVASFLDGSNCPAGQARIAAGTKVPIDVNYIPRGEHWYWEYQGTSECKPIPKPMKYLAYTQTDHFYPGIIITKYGSDDNQEFTFVFHIPPDYWDCGDFYGPVIPTTIGCAQDMN